MKSTEEKGLYRAWCEYRNWEYVEGFTIPPSENFAKGYGYGRRDALASQWRNVDDELPKENEDVFVRYANYVGGLEYGCAYYDGEDWYTTNDNLIRPTHWMPIPEPPKTKKK